MFSSQNVVVWVSFSVWILPAPCMLLVLHMFKMKVKCYLMFCFDKLLLPLFIIEEQLSTWSCPIASGYLSQCYSASEIFLPQSFYNKMSGLIGHGRVRNGCVGHHAYLLFVSACHGFSTKKIKCKTFAGWVHIHRVAFHWFMQISSPSLLIRLATSCTHVTSE